VEPGFLLIAERIVEPCQWPAHGADRVEHRFEALLGGVEPAERPRGRFVRARPFQPIGGVRRGTLEFLEARALRLGRLHPPWHAGYREMHQARGFATAQWRELVGASALRRAGLRIVARYVSAPVAVAGVSVISPVRVGPIDSAEQIAVAVCPERSVIIVAAVGIV